ncbi:MAG: hypothetical protein JSR58_06600 [Verrucomicrobia bacterium]|nr:hypothetical protein [Verrucomicrobiota bacterium]
MKTDISFNQPALPYENIPYLIRTISPLVQEKRFLSAFAAIEYAFRKNIISTAQYYYWVGVVYEAEGNFPTALRSIELAMILSPTNTALNEIKNRIITQLYNPLNR